MSLPEKRKITSYRDLLVWQKAMDLVEASYLLAKRLPQSEIYGLMSQIRRSAVSIPANIAEGHGRRRLGDYLHHLSIANGSLMELETHFFITIRLGYLQTEEVEPAMKLAEEVGKMLGGLVMKLESTRT